MNLVICNVGIFIIIERLYCAQYMIYTDIEYAHNTICEIFIIIILYKNRSPKLFSIIIPIYILCYVYKNVLFKNQRRIYKCICIFSILFTDFLNIDSESRFLFYFCIDLDINILTCVNNFEHFRFKRKLNSLQLREFLEVSKAGTFKRK